MRYGWYATAIIIIAFCVVLTVQVFRFYFQPIINSVKPMNFTLSQGTTSRGLAKQLYNRGLLHQPLLFILMARLKGDARNLQAGGYRLYPGATANQVLNQIANGDVAIENITIIEGWTVKNMLQAIAHNKYIDHTIKGKSISQIAKIIGINYKNPEGWFFPDTYHFTWGTKDIEILKKAHQLMQQHLKKAWASRESDLRYRNPYQALIVASMVVKEANLPSERPIVAGVILNRLRVGMRLQIDPTVIYGMGDNYKGKITINALRTPTPYNTYTKYGMPPTPISLPGESSIYAALHPAITNYFYFVAKGDGSHVFSRTLKEQDKAIRKYILHQD